MVEDSVGPDASTVTVLGSGPLTESPPEIVVVEPSLSPAMAVMGIGSSAAVVAAGRKRGRTVRALEDDALQMTVRDLLKGAAVRAGPSEVGTMGGMAVPDVATMQIDGWSPEWRGAKHGVKRLRGVDLREEVVVMVGR